MKSLPLSAKAAPTTAKSARCRSKGKSPCSTAAAAKNTKWPQDQKQYDLPDLLKEREDWLYGPEPPKEGKRGAIGIPRTMFFQELMPFFRAFFEDLGFTVVFSQKTNKQVINQGVEALAAEPCYPVKVAHGHILDLLKAGVKRIFLPSIIDLPHPHPEFGSGVVCPMAQSLAYTVPTAIDFAAYGAKVLSPVLYFGRGHNAGCARVCESWGKNWECRSFLVNRAMRRALAAQQAYYERLRTRGREILASCRPTAVSWSSSAGPTTPWTRA